MDAGILQRSYDTFAPRYDEIFEPQQAPKIQNLKAALEAHWSTRPEPVLDAGCGTGLVGRLTGWTPVQLDLARKMLDHNPGSRRVQAELARLPFADGAFGLVISVTALIDYEAGQGLVQELVRVTRPGGWLAISLLKVEDIAGFETDLARCPVHLETRLDLEQDLGFILRRIESVSPDAEAV